MYNTMTVTTKGRDGEKAVARALSLDGFGDAGCGDARFDPDLRKRKGPGPRRKDDGSTGGAGWVGRGLCEGEESGWMSGRG